MMNVHIPPSGDAHNRASKPQQILNCLDADLRSLVSMALRNEKPPMPSATAVRAYRQAQSRFDQRRVLVDLVKGRADCWAGYGTATEGGAA